MHAAPPAEPPAPPTPLIEACGIGVRYGSFAALRDVDFGVLPGEVHALMGENGAGKSTLIKCLTGVLEPDEGEIRVAGRGVRFGSPREAERAGVSAVFQEVGLIPHLSVAENICLGREPLRRGWPRLIRWGEVRTRAKRALERLGLGGVNPDSMLSDCSVAVQQLTAIARALDTDACVLVLDEPTSSLDTEECTRLFDVLRRLRADGMGVVLITHFLAQVEAIADRVTVLRDGRCVGTFDAKSLSRRELVSCMVGREIAPGGLAPPMHGTGGRREPVLEARGLGRRGSLAHVDLRVSAGEAIGLAGLLGSGRSETARALFGAEPADHGEVFVRGVRTAIRSPRDAIASGIGFTPENRKADGIFPSLSVLENMVIALQARRGIFARVARAEITRLWELASGRLRLKSGGAHVPIASLSGGNQQKAVLARWLAIGPDVLILDEPTRGIDIAAKADVLAEVEHLKAGGTALVFISSEIDEVARVCDSVVVLRDGRSIAELSGDDVSEERVLAKVAQRDA